MDFVREVERLFSVGGVAFPICRCNAEKVTAEICLTSEDEICNSSHQSLHEVSLEYTWSELSHATCGFSSARILGKGRSSTVYRGRLEEGVDVAIKVMQESPGTGLHDEVRLLSRCHHPNLVMLLGFSLDDYQHRQALVYELLPGGSAFSRLHAPAGSSPPYVWQERLKTGIQVSRGLAHLHRLRPEVFHRDIKTSVILFASDGTAKLADFGFACTSKNRDQRCSASVGTNGALGYSSPEYAEKGVATEASEVYSMGMVLIELLTGRLPSGAGGANVGRALLEQELASGRLPDGVDPVAQWPEETAAGIGAFSLLCVQCNAAKRPSFIEVVTVLQHISVIAEHLQQEALAADTGSSASKEPADAGAGTEGRGLLTTLKRSLSSSPALFGGKRDADKPEGALEDAATSEAKLLPVLQVTEVLGGKQSGRTEWEDTYSDVVEEESRPEAAWLPQQLAPSQEASPEPSAAKTHAREEEACNGSPGCDAAGIGLPQRPPAEDGSHRPDGRMPKTWGEDTLQAYAGPRGGLVGGGLESVRVLTPLSGSMEDASPGAHKEPTLGSAQLRTGYGGRDAEAAAPTAAQGGAEGGAPAEPQGWLQSLRRSLGSGADAPAGSAAPRAGPQQQDAEATPCRDVGGAGRGEAAAEEPKALETEHSESSDAGTSASGAGRRLLQSLRWPRGAVGQQGEGPGEAETNAHLARWDLRARADEVTGDGKRWLQNWIRPLTPSTQASTQETSGAKAELSSASEWEEDEEVETSESRRWLQAWRWPSKPAVLEEGSAWPPPHTMPWAAPAPAPAQLEQAAATAAEEVRAAPSGAEASSASAGATPPLVGSARGARELTGPGMRPAEPEAWSTDRSAIGRLYHISDLVD